MKLGNVPHLFSVRSDGTSAGYYDAYAYRPLVPYDGPEPCEACWLTPNRSIDSEARADWFDHADQLRAVGGPGCPHGSPS